jgi:hypothetical protein
MVAIGKVVFSSREHIIALEARGKGMLGAAEGGARGKPAARSVQQRGAAKRRRADQARAKDEQVRIVLRLLRSTPARPHLLDLRMQPS